MFLLLFSIFYLLIFLYVSVGLPARRVAREAQLLLSEAFLRLLPAEKQPLLLLLRPRGPADGRRGGEEACPKG